MDFIVDILRSILFATITISILEILVPEGNLKKYFKYLSGLIFLVILIKPISNIDINKSNFEFDKNSKNNYINEDILNNNMSEEFLKRSEEFLEKNRVTNENNKNYDGNKN